MNLEKNRQYNKAYFARMTAEERKKFYRDRYYKYKDRYNKQSKQWAKDNPEKSQASVHQTTIRTKYPEAYKHTDISTKDLVVWIKNHRSQECKYCGQSSTHIDHIVPLAQGGTHTWSNIQMICKDCNLSKLNRTEEQFLSWIKKILDKHGT